MRFGLNRSSECRKRRYIVCFERWSGLTCLGSLGGPINEGSTVKGRLHKSRGSMGRFGAVPFGLKAWLLGLFILSLVKPVRAEDV